jgi:hypothetical protein
VPKKTLFLIAHDFGELQNMSIISFANRSLTAPGLHTKYRSHPENILNESGE